MDLNCLSIVWLISFISLIESRPWNSTSVKLHHRNHPLKNLKNIQNIVSSTASGIRRLKKEREKLQRADVSGIQEILLNTTKEAIANLSQIMTFFITNAVVEVRRKAVRKTFERDILDYYIDVVEREYFTNYYDDYEINETYDEGHAEDHGHGEEDENTHGHYLQEALASELSTNVEKEGRLSTAAFQAISNILDAVGEREKVPFNFSYCIDDSSCNDTVTAVVQIDKSSSLAKKNISVGTGDRKIYLSLPTSISAFSKSLSVQVISSEKNPFMFDPSVRELLGPILSVHVKDPSTNLYLLTNQTIDIMIPWNASKFLTSPQSQNLAENFSVTVKPLKNLEYDQFPILFISLLPDAIAVVDLAADVPGVEVLVVVKKTFRPSPKDFCNIAAIAVTSSTSPKENGMYPFDAINFQADTNVDGPNGATSNDYFIGIYPHDAKYYGSKLNFEISIWRPSCVFRDEDKQVWSEKECRVSGRNLSESYLHCTCRHMSTFSVTQFITPTILEHIEASPFALLIEKNLYVIIGTGVILLIFIILLLILRHFDVKDSLHPGLHIMVDFGDEHVNMHYYLIVVYSGGLWSPFCKGTTANISLQIYGCTATSVSYVIREDNQKIKILQNNGVDCFLVSSPKYLGTLERIRIWRDNHGKNPDWYCRKVIIRCLRTEQDFHFFVNKMLTVGRFDESMSYEIPVATKKKIKSWKRRYFENVYNDFNERHTWFGTFRRRPGSYFTRCQRLACAIKTVFIATLGSFLLHGAFEENGIIDVAYFHTYVYQLLIGVELFVLTLPTELFLRFLFRRIRQKDIPTILVWPTKRKSQFNNYQIFGRQDQEMNPHSELYAVYFAQQAGNPEENQDFYIPQTNKSEMENWIANVPANLVQYNKPEPDHYIRAIQDTDTTALKLEDSKQQALKHLRRADNINLIRNIVPSSFTFAVNNNNENESLEKKITDEIQKNSFWTKEIKKNPFLIRKIRKLTRRNRKENYEIRETKNRKKKTRKKSKGNVKKKNQGKTKAKKKRKRKWKNVLKLPPVKIAKFYADTKKDKFIKVSICRFPPVAKKCHLPSSFVFVPWFLSLVLILGSAVMVNIYGLWLGPLISQKIMMDVALATAQSIFLTQPLLIVIIAAIKTTLCRKIDIVEEERFQTINLKKKPTFKRKPFKYEIFKPERSHPPLCCNESFKLKIKAIRSHYANRGPLLIILHIFLMILLLIISYSNFSSHHFLASRNIEAVLHIEDKWSQIKNAMEFYEYLDEIIDKSIYPQEYYNLKHIPYTENLPVIFNDEQSFLVGIPRLRQFRIHPNSLCIDTSKVCPSEFWIDFDHNNYSPHWLPPNTSATNNFPHNNIWMFTKDTDSILHFGLIRNYPNGGYAAYLGRNLYRSHSVLHYLERSDWIDSKTRAIFLEMTSYNPNVNLFFHTKLVAEITGPGSWFTSSVRYPLTLLNPDSFEKEEDNSVINLAIVHCLIVLLIIIKIVIQIYEWKIYKVHYISEWIFIALVLTSVGIAVYRLILIIPLKEKLETIKINEHLAIDETCFWDQTQTDMFALTFCFGIMMIWEFLFATRKEFYILIVSLRLSKNYLLAQAFLMAIIIVSFSLLGYFLFGSYSFALHSVYESIISHVQEAIDIYIREGIVEQGGILAEIFVITFTFTQLIMGINIFISLINTGIREAKLIAGERKHWVNYLQCLWSRCPKRHFRPPPILLPQRLQAMKEMTRVFIKSCLETPEVQRFQKMYQLSTQFLEGTIFRLVSNRSTKKRQRQKENQDFRLEIIRLFTLKQFHASKSKKIFPDELKAHHDFQQKILVLKLRQLETKLKKLMNVIEKF